MRDTGNTDLRKLVHDYYDGELSYSSYRQARTELLDRITAVTGDAGCTRSTTRGTDKSSVAGQSPGHKTGTFRILRGIVWLLIAVLIVVLLVWVVQSESNMLSLQKPDPGDITISSSAAARAVKNSKEKGWHIDG
jgi:hypothetical protein